jgi:hypothetical protein
MQKTAKTKQKIPTSPTKTFSPPPLKKKTAKPKQKFLKPPKAKPKD